MKLISWQTYLKSKPDKYVINDFIGSRLIVDPTLRANGFTITDYHEYYKDDGLKPKQIAENILKSLPNVEKNLSNIELAVYCPMIARDGHCRWITLGYKLKS